GSSAAAGPAKTAASARAIANRFESNMSIEGVIEAGGVPTKALSHIEEGNRNLIPFEPADFSRRRVPRKAAKSPSITRIHLYLTPVFACGRKKAQKRRTTLCVFAALREIIRSIFRCGRGPLAFY